jgi:hypothetical protein
VPPTPSPPPGASAAGAEGSGAGIALALRFDTWRTLVRDEGLADEEAVDVARRLTCSRG